MLQSKQSLDQEKLALYTYEKYTWRCSPLSEIFPQNQPGMPQAMSILSVTDLTRCIRAVIEAEDLFADVWVRGEISNLKEHTSGPHLFLPQG